MELINEEDNCAFRALHFSQDSFQAGRNLVSVFCMINQSIETETEQAFVTQTFGDFAVSNSLRQTLGNCGDAGP
ncbi:MAG: hypothetical protein DMF71_13015 [Acidobacteria bacterium]|nr:MAG: hypothetical protein DMF71_13015 [Acidobacteriota bacterium]